MTSVCRLPGTLVSTGLAMVCFAANSLLCRQALVGGEADAGSFTLIRVASGAAVLWGICLARGGGPVWSHGNWISAACLTVYALGFSTAYLHLEAGTGTLVLFAAVQGSMIGWGLLRGERPRIGTWLGMRLGARKDTAA